MPTIRNHDDAVPFEGFRVDETGRVRHEWIAADGTPSGWWPLGDDAGTFLAMGSVYFEGEVLVVTAVGAGWGDSGPVLFAILRLPGTGWTKWATLSQWLTMNYSPT